MKPELTEVLLFDCSCSHVCGDEAGVAPAATAMVHARSHWLRVLAGVSEAPPPHPQASMCQQMWVECNSKFLPWLMLNMIDPLSLPPPALRLNDSQCVHADQFSLDKWVSINDKLAPSWSYASYPLLILWPNMWSIRVGLHHSKYYFFPTHDVWLFCVLYFIKFVLKVWHLVSWYYSGHEFSCTSLHIFKRWILLLYVSFLMSLMYLLLFTILTIWQTHLRTSST